MKRPFICHSCKQEVTLGPEGIGTGYGLDENDMRICYRCCADNDRKFMVENGVHGGMYVIKEGEKYIITNWPGTLRFPVKTYWYGNHNWGGKVMFFRFSGPDGYEWYGRNVPGKYSSQIIRVRRTKEKVR